MRRLEYTHLPWGRNLDPDVRCVCALPESWRQNSLAFPVFMLLFHVQSSSWGFFQCNLSTRGAFLPYQQVIWEHPRTRLLPIPAFLQLHHYQSAVGRKLFIGSSSLLPRWQVHIPSTRASSRGSGNSDMPQMCRLGTSQGVPTQLLTQHPGHNLRDSRQRPFPLQKRWKSAPPTQDLWWFPSPWTDVGRGVLWKLLWKLDHKVKAKPIAVGSRCCTTIAGELRPKANPVSLSVQHRTFSGTGHPNSDMVSPVKHTGGHFIL